MMQAITTKLAITAAAVLATCQMASASLSISGSVGGAPTGVNYANFDNFLLGSSGGIDNGITVTFTPDGASVQGAESSKYAAPWLSGGNGAGFGGQTDGADTTKYLTSGGPNGKATLTFNGSQVYLGLLWGSVDSYNTLSFYNNDVLVGTVTGSNVISSPNGDQGVNGTVYVNITSTLAFNRVEATSSQYAFEFDNVAFSATAPVPEPSTVVAGALLLLPFGASAIRVLRKKKVG